MKILPFHLIIEVGIGKCIGSATANLKERVEFQGRVKQFFICCLGLGGLLLFMNAIVDAWVRGKLYCGMLIHCRL